MIDTPLELDDTVIISRRPGMIVSEIDGELVGLHLDSGNCYGFNDTATKIWALIENPMAFGSVCAELTAEFDIDSATCRRETALLITELVRERLAEVAPTI